MIVINSPNNPSGTILNEDSMLIIKNIVKKYNLYLISDQVYDSLSYKDMIYPYNQDIKDNIIIINSLSKSHNLTGWRIGYMLSNKKIINHLTSIKQYMNICLPGFMELTLKKCLKLKNKNIKEYHQSVTLIYKTLKEFNIDVTMPDAGYYLFFDISKFKMNSLTFALKLAEEYKIGVMPGIFFHKENYIRISCIKPYKEMLQTQSKLKKALKELTKKV